MSARVLASGRRQDGAHLAQLERLSRYFRDVLRLDRAATVHELRRWATVEGLAVRPELLHEVVAFVYEGRRAA